MSANRAEFPVKTMCRVLGLSTSGYYAWAKRGPSPRAVADKQMLGQIRQIHRLSRHTYGRPRIHAELREEGVRISAKRIARLMKQGGLVGVTRRRKWRTTQRSGDARPAPDLVKRNFNPPGPNRLWVSDITYVPTKAGFYYLAVVVDAWSRRVIGWSMRPDMETKLVVSALEMALSQRRRPKGVIFHSDQGTQYTSLGFGARCREAGLQRSMGRVGDAYDNAMCESFFATLECELLDRTTFANHSEAHTAIFDFIEGWYNTRRRHSALGYHSPRQYELAHAHVA